MSEPHEDNLLNNPWFEDWSDGLPEHWEGSHSSGNWLQTDEEAIAGDYSVLLDGGGERRLSQGGFTVDGDTEYSWGVMVKGEGEIEIGRTHGSGFTSYEDTVVVDSRDWQLIQASSEPTEGDEAGIVIRTRDEAEDDLYLGAAWFSDEEIPHDWLEEEEEELGHIVRTDNGVVQTHNGTILTTKE